MAVASFPRLSCGYSITPTRGEQGPFGRGLCSIWKFLSPIGRTGGKPLTSPGKVLSCVQKQLNKCSNENGACAFERRPFHEKKTYKIDVDCANCANKMEDAANKTPGVKNAVVNFMTLKMNVEFEAYQDPKTVMEQVRTNCKRWRTTARSSLRPPPAIPLFSSKLPSCRCCGRGQPTWSKPMKRSA